MNKMYRLMFTLLKDNCTETSFRVICVSFSDESLEKKSVEHNDSDKKAVSESGPDPSAPITRKGVLTSFLTGKAMEIPEQDIVINSILFYL